MPQAWSPAVAPTYRRRASITIEVNGRDVTSILDPHLISVHVTLRRWGDNKAHIELDDRDASLDIPRWMDPVNIWMGWAGSGPTLPLAPRVERLYRMIIPEKYLDGSPYQELPYRASGTMAVFQGQIEDVESGFSRTGGGRRLWIDCSSSNANTTGWKSPSLVTMGQGDPGDGGGQEISVVDFLKEVGKQWGITVEAGPGIDNIKRKFWSADGESFGSIGQRLMSELGLGFKIIGNKAYLINNEQTFNNELYPTIEAVWGVNLINWRIKPYSSRPQWKEGKQRFFDIYAGLFKSVTKAFNGKIPFGDSQAISGLPAMAPNAQVGQQYNDGQSADSEWNRGYGFCMINGEPSAQPFGNVVITGARPGVDGRYVIDEAEHDYDRGGGYTTRLKLDRPQLNGDDYKQNSWGQFPPDARSVLNSMGYLTVPPAFNANPGGAPPAGEPGAPIPPVSY